MTRVLPAQAWLACLVLLSAWHSPSALAADTPPALSKPPTTPVVTDDGVYTTSTTQLHAIWTSAELEAKIAEYHYLIRQDAVSGPIVVKWTSTGKTASVTRTGLSLLPGKSYYFGVKAKNRAGLWSAVGYSNGITVDTTPPTGTITIDGGAALTNTTAVTLTLAATDDSGTVSQMQCSNDNVTYSTPEPYATTKSWTLTSGEGTKTVYAKFQDPAGSWSSAVSDTIILDTTAPQVVITYPHNGMLLGSS